MITFNNLTEKLISFSGITELISRYTPNDILICASTQSGMDGMDINELTNLSSGTYYYGLKDLKENLPHYIWLWNRLTDSKSREVLENLLRFRILPIMERLQGEDNEICIEADIECSGVNDVLRLKEHIRDNSPSLVVQLCNIISDIWELPRLVDAINPNYSLYLLYVGDGQNKKITLYAVYKKPVIKPLPINKILGVYALSPFYQKWTNQQLLKDCGIVPYMLQKNYGYKATMVGVKNGEYPYLERYLGGMAMDILPDCKNNEDMQLRQLEYIDRHYKKMDIMILNGPYPNYYKIMQRYRELRPDGKVYIGLDANSSWMDRIIWTEPDFMRLLSQCDVIATSCRKMQRHLSLKWPHWRIEYIPNGFFNAEGDVVNVDLRMKENIILTVGRIGIPDKANHVLLEAFAGAAERLPDWNVRLVGRIDPGFQAYVDSYFIKYPALVNRVVFTGLVESKSELYAEYAKAKIFTLTSIKEGGTPNVVAEALYHGCYIITSDIDASDDAINNGVCGSKFPINDINALKDILLELCPKQGFFKDKFSGIIDYAKTNYDWDLIIKRLHHLLMKV